MAAGKKKAPAKRPPAKKAATKPRGARSRATKGKSGRSIADRTKDEQATQKRPGAPKGARLTAAKQALRDSVIMQRVAQGWTWATIAEEAGISERSCQRVAENHRGITSPLEVTPTALIEELAMGYRFSIGDFTAMALAYAEWHPSAAVGARKAADEAREKLAALLQATGHLPHDLGTIKLQRDVEHVARTMLDAVQSFQRGDIDAEKLGQVFYDLAGIPPVPELPPGR